MSKIKLPHSSGNSMSIGAPATNPASDLELKLPATIGAANQLLKNSGTAGTLEFSSGLTFDGTDLKVVKDLIPTVHAQNTNAASYARVILNQSSGSGGYAALNKLGTSSTAIGGANATQLWCTGDAPLVFGVNNAERMRIGSDGKLLAGRTSSITIASDPSDHNFEQLTDNGMALALHCNQTNQRGLGIFYTASKAPTDFFRCHVDSAAKVIITGTGNMQNANNSYGSISDISLKENIVDANSQWDDIKNIKIRNYNFKESTGQSTHTQIGVIAQELETVSPKLVEISDKDGMKNVQYSVLYIKAVKALQEAMVKIETLETKVAALEAA